jgi:hypothetical protein
MRLPWRWAPRMAFWMSVTERLNGTRFARVTIWLTYIKRAFV